MSNQAENSTVTVSISRVHFQRIQGIVQDRVDYMRFMLKYAYGDKRTEIERDIAQTLIVLREIGVNTQ